MNAPSARHPRHRGLREVAGAFLVLGLTAFGGPIAHVAYFREEFVRRRGWLDDAAFARLIALCQCLPGPTSSQLGVAIGHARAGWPGAAAAFIAFTLPSALAMYAIARHLLRWLGSAPGQVVLHGLKLLAVVVVTHGLWSMARTLTPDARRIGVAGVAAVCVLAVGGAGGQVLALGAGALLGLWALRAPRASMGAQTPFVAVAPDDRPPASRRGTGWALAFFVAGLAWASWPRTAEAPALEGLVAAHYQAGALVFGGGHVVLPLLEQRLVAPGWLDPSTFLAGYGAAQAVPGPMFSLASYLGAAVDTGASPALASLLATLALFAPGFLLLAALLPWWQRLSAHRHLGAALGGLGAAVVGLLAAALYDPIWTGGVQRPVDVAIVAVGLWLCSRGVRPIVLVLPWCLVATALVAVVR